MNCVTDLENQTNQKHSSILMILCYIRLIILISELSQYVRFCLFVLSANLCTIAIFYINRIGLLPCAIQAMAERFHKRIDEILIQFSHSNYALWRNE